MEFTYRGEEKQTFRGQNLKTNKPCQQYIYWLIRQGSYVCIHVSLCSHVSLNDTTGWRGISDKLNRGSGNCKCLFLRFSEKCGSPEELQARMKGKSIKSETFRSFSLKNTDIMPEWRWRKWPFQRNVQKTHRTVYSSTAQTLTNFGKLKIHFVLYIFNDAPHD